MDWVLLGVLVGFPLLAHAVMAAYASYDAARHGMDPRKWGALSFFVPFFGFFAYVFERDERTRDTTERDEMFVDGPFQIHKSRAEDTPLVSSPGEETAEDANRDGTPAPEDDSDTRS